MTMGNWASWSDFLAMGGYGLYVWGSFAMCALALLLETGLLRARLKALRRQAAEDAAESSSSPSSSDLSRPAKP